MIFALLILCLITMGVASTSCRGEAPMKDDIKDKVEKKPYNKRSSD